MHRTVAYGTGIMGSKKFIRSRVGILISRNVIF